MSMTQDAPVLVVGDELLTNLSSSSDSLVAFATYIIPGPADLRGYMRERPKSQVLRNGALRRPRFNTNLAYPEAEVIVRARQII
jgi:hypothetical protein